jgi:hypothetical protein
VNLHPFADDPNQKPRWMNIADYLYASSFRSTFRYPDNTVTLTYTTQEAPLRFTVRAPYRTLKPDFCYQMKIEGPRQPWSNDPTGDDFVNYQLGSNGRWWCDSCNASLADGQVAAHAGHYVKGYLYFDFLVTDRNGAAQQTATVSNSYHVTWKTSQRARAANDGRVRSCLVAGTKDGWAYDRNRRAVTVGLYGEWEPGRALPGTLALAPGSYGGVEFRLTEESFHSSNPHGGTWRTVMSAPNLSFVISG